MKTVKPKLLVKDKLLRSGKALVNVELRPLRREKRGTEVQHFECYPYNTTLKKHFPWVQGQAICFRNLARPLASPMSLGTRIRAVSMISVYYVNHNRLRKQLTVRLLHANNYEKQGIEYPPSNFSAIAR